MDKRRLAVGIGTALLGLIMTDSDMLNVDLKKFISTKTIESYGRNLRGAVRALWKGTWDVSTFIFEVGQALERAFEQAWAEGARSQGVEPDERTPEEQAKLDQLIFEQSAYIPGLADFVLAHSKIQVPALPSPVAVDIERPPAEFIPTPAQPTAPAPTGGTFVDGTTYRQSKLSPTYDKSVELNDAVLGTGEAELRVKMGGGSDFSSEGVYEPWGNGTGKIKLKPNADWNHQLTIHEMGHAIDHQILSENLGLDVNLQKWASESRIKEVREYWDVVEESPSYKKLLEMSKIEPDAYLDYLLEPREVWARTYQEYITFKTRDPTLISEIVDRIDNAFYPEHWGSADFAPIAAKMDAIFERAGMLKIQ